MAFIAAHATAHAHRAASPFYRAVDCTASGTLTGSVVQLLPCCFKGIAVAAPIIIVAAFAVPADIRVRGFRVMPDDKLRVPDSELSMVS